MRVVHLDCPLRIKILEAAAAEFVNPNHILQRTGDEKVLLFQAELFALGLFIIGIQNAGDGFRFRLSCRQPRRSLQD